MKESLPATMGNLIAYSRKPGVSGYDRGATPLEAIAAYDELVANLTAPYRMVVKQAHP